MRRSLFAACLTGVLALATAASAQSPFDLNTPPVGKQAGTLTVGDATHSATFHLSGSHAPTGFHRVTDGHGGVAISFG